MIHRIQRRPPVDRPPVARPVLETHDLAHPDCLLAQAGQRVPGDLQPAWQRALAWQPKLEGWTQEFAAALADVLGGRRPLLYGWPHAALQEAARAHHLVWLDLGWVSVAALPACADLARLVAWGHTQPAETLHVVTGVALGYPLGAVEAWVRAGCPGPTLREVLAAYQLREAATQGGVGQVGGPQEGEVVLRGV